MNAATHLAPWSDLGIFESVEEQLADLLVRRFGATNPLTLFAAALAVRAQRDGHTCLDLRQIDEVVGGALGEDAVDIDLAGLPTSEEVRRVLLDEPDIVRLVEKAGADTTDDPHPFVLSGNRLYTQRQWVDERSVARRLRELTASDPSFHLPEAGLLDRLLPEDGDPHQHRAGLTTLKRRVTVVVGGPGTGKTFTTVRLLAMFAASEAVRVVVAAPTGKAANRLLEAIGEAIDGSESPGLMAPLAQLRPSTIHRLLGHRAPLRSRFRHDAGHPLAADVVVIDEMSMVPLQLMARLLEAVPDGAQVILVGDPDQLESIGAGSVLRDLVDSTSADGSPLEGAITRLETVRRVAEESPIADLAADIRSGDPDRVIERLRAGSDDIRWIDTETPTEHAEAVLRHICPMYQTARDAIRDDTSDDAVARSLDAVGDARLLCGHWRGEHGVHTWNDLVAEHLGDRRDDWTLGRQVLVTANDPRTGLVNGDNGIVLRPDSGPIVAFRRPTGIERIPVVRLPPTLTAYAMTAHRSQGSEYGSVVVIVPPDGSPLLTRELLYTAATRAKRSLLVVGSGSAIRRAVSTPSLRVSGLVDALSDSPSESGIDRAQ
jgi:exodeoxyribonuclease V alpha subunit